MFISKYKYKNKKQNKQLMVNLEYTSPECFHILRFQKKNVVIHFIIKALKKHLNLG